MDLNLFWVSIVTAVIGGLILIELAAWSPRIAMTLTTFAAGRLPLSKRARFREEWLAYLADMPTGFSKVVAALGFVGTAERDRIGSGFRTIRAIRDYVRIRMVMRPYLAEARAFGGAWLALRLKLQPCGNRHFVIDGVFPAAAVPFMQEYRECLSQEAHENIDLLEERVSIIQRAQQAIEEPSDGRVMGEVWGGYRMTDFILPTDRDPRAMRTLLFLLWKRRQRSIRRSYRLAQRQH